MGLQHSHSICVVSHNNYAALYGKVNTYLSNGYAVVYAVEGLTVRDTIQKMNNTGITVNNYIDSNALTILNRNSVYSQDRTKFEGQLLLETWKEILSGVNQKGNFKGVAVMGMPEPFFETKNHQKLVEYEQLVSRVFDGSLEAICCYIQSSIVDLSLEHLVSLLNSHQNTVPDAEAKHREWQPTKLLDMIGNGLEKTVGKTTSQLTLEAIKAMYKIDEKTIISQPGLFEKGIKKMFADSAWVILDAIKNEIITGISFNQTSQARQGVAQASRCLNFLLCQSCNWSATAVSSWRPVICPVCHNSTISSLSMNYPNGNKR